MKKNFDDFYNDIKENKEINEIWSNTIKELKKKSIIATFITIAILVVGNYFLFKFLYYYFPNFRLPIIDDIKPKVYTKNDVPNILLYTVVVFSNILTYFIIHVSIFTGTKTKYNKNYKTIIIHSLLNNFFTEVNYSPKKEMPKTIYKEGHYEEYNEYESDDYMEGIIDNKYNIVMAEVSTYMITHEKNSDGETETNVDTLFSGLFSKIYLGKNINNKIRIEPNSSYKGKNSLEMDSEEFEKYFDVTATDKIVGMQILTHDVMELLINYNINHKGEFDIYIKDDNLYIRYEVGELFEPILNKKEVIDKKLLKKYFKATEFIDLLASSIIRIIEETPI